MNSRFLKKDMYKNIEDKRKYEREYYWKNHEKVLIQARLWQKEWRNKKENKTKLFLRNRKYRQKYPWMKTLFSIYKRVRGKEAKLRYFDRGIKNSLTKEDLESLWFRDKAYEMDRPTLHRKNNNGNYSFENCEYMECGEHSRLHRTMERNTK